MSGAKDRDKWIDQLRVRAKDWFAAHPEWQTVMLSVAQYWNDQASDETHAHLTASARAVPVWPHVCEDYNDEIWDDAAAAMVPNPSKRVGEVCSHCRYDDLDAYIGVAEWEPYCPESAHQEMTIGEAYQPYAIVRRGGEVERIGRLLRPHAELISGEPARGTMWDARGRELYAEVCAHPADDGPRAVLSDHLLESRATAVASPGFAGARSTPEGSAESIDPRGEYIALALARELDADARGRRDALLAAHLREWIRPLGAIVPDGCAWFARGFLARVHVYATEVPASTPTWSTVEELRYLPGSIDFVDPAMTALRDVAICGDRALRQLASTRQPWAIETLQLDGDPLLLAGASLPQLRELIVPAERFTALRTLGLPEACRITVIGADGTLPSWHATLRALEPLRAIALTGAGFAGDPAGWRYTLDPRGDVVVDVAGWHAEATLAACATRLAELPASATITLRDSPYRVFDELDRAELAERSGRTVIR